MVIVMFINPKTDFAFKKIFGSEQSKDILISFLNAMLYDGQDTIEDLQILDPYQAPRIQGIKDSFLDIKSQNIQYLHLNNNSTFVMKLDFDI